MGRIRSPRQWLTDELVKILTTPLSSYNLHSKTDPAKLRGALRKGDVILVEGDQRISVVIKYLTQSSWSHSAFYIGDEALRRFPERRAELEEQFGDEADHLIVEALMEGVVLSPVSKYLDFNLRVCRPYGLRKDDLQHVLDDLFERLGHSYDIQNILDLARYFFPVSLIPQRFRRKALTLGSGKPTEVICSSIIAEAFHAVGFPIMPNILPDDGAAPTPTWQDRLLRRPALPLGKYLKRPPTLITPREYDLSPFFQIVKFNFIEQGGFDYRKIVWVDETHVKVPEGSGSA